VKLCGKRRCRSDDAQPAGSCFFRALGQSPRFTLPAIFILQHMIKYKYVPFSFGKPKHKGKEVRAQHHPSDVAVVQPPFLLTLRFFPLS